jgi:hypothetical protein
VRHGNGSTGVAMLAAAFHAKGRRAKCGGLVASAETVQPRMEDSDGIIETVRVADGDESLTARDRGRTGQRTERGDGELRLGQCHGPRRTAGRASGAPSFRTAMAAGRARAAAATARPRAEPSESPPRHCPSEEQVPPGERRSRRKLRGLA